MVLPNKDILCHVPIDDQLRYTAIDLLERRGLVPTEEQIEHLMQDLIIISKKVYSNYFMLQ